MSERGYLDGRQMAGAFALINSKDLVWSKLVHEYLMGAQTPLTDLRAWNADATRMPARMHGEYLRKLYLDNDLAEGRYRVRGRPVVLADIDWPMYVVATERDHVSPWRSVYKIHLLTDTELRFVLTSGGHNVGVVNPAGALPRTMVRAFARTCALRDAPYVEPQAWLDESDVARGFVVGRLGAVAAGAFVGTRRRAADRRPRTQALAVARAGAGPLCARDLILRQPIGTRSARREPASLRVTGC